MKRVWSKIVVVIGVVCALWACTKMPDNESGANSDAFLLNRAAVLTNLADNLIIPAYASFNNSFTAMKTDAETFAANPTLANLTQLRASWVTAYTEWQKVELFDVGPAESLTIRYFFNIYPANVDVINANIQNPSANLEIPTNYPAQGFPALDYLINGLGSTDAEILSFYTSDVNAAKRLAYLKKINDHMSDLLNQVIAGWNGDYRNTFISKTKLDIGSSTSLLVNALTLHYERYIRSGKIGIPSGAMMNGVVAPEKVESYYKKDLSGILARTAHQAFVDMFNGKGFANGTQGPSLKTYLDALDAKDATTNTQLSVIINTQLEACQNRLNGLPNNFYDEIGNNSQSMKDAYTDLQKTVKYFKVDLASAMSVTITYTDNDGD